MKKLIIPVLLCVVTVIAVLCGCGNFNGSTDEGSGGYATAPWIADGENYAYDSVVEQGFSDVGETPSSYFSLDRNTAGYSLVRAQIKQGLAVSPDSVRLEEMVNYFDYDYPAPADGEAVGVSAYLSDCPWNDEHKLMTVGIRTEEATAAGDANYVLLVDVSGSMGSYVSATRA